MNAPTRVASVAIALAMLTKSARNFYDEIDHYRLWDQAELKDRQDVYSPSSSFFVDGSLPTVLNESFIDIVNCYSYQTTLEASWRLSDDPTDVFMWRAVVHEDHFLPLKSGMVALASCVSSSWQFNRPVGVVIIADARSSYDLKPGHVVVPINGEARIDGDDRVRVVAMSDGVQIYPDRLLDPSDEGTRTTAALSEGDSFDWGRRRATIVRIHKTREMYLSTDWVEIALSPRLPVSEPTATPPPSASLDTAPDLTDHPQ